MLGFDLRAARIAWTVFLVGLAVFIAYAIRSSLLVVVLAGFFSYLIYPLVGLVERHKPRWLPRTGSIALVFLFVILLAGFSAVMFGARIADEAVHLGRQLPQQLNSANVSERIPLPGFLKPQRARILAFISEQVRSGTAHALPFAQRLGLALVRAATDLIYLVLIPILSFLLIKDAPALKREILSLPGWSRGSLWSAIIEDLDVLFSKYVRALLILSMAAFVAYCAALSALGVPFALLLGGVAGVLEVIPFIGPLTAAATILAVAAFSGYGHLLWIAGFILAYRIFQDYILSPYLMSEGIEVSPLLVIVGLLAGEELGGVAGVFLSVPALAVLKIVFVRVMAFQAPDKRSSAREQPPHSSP
jgi:predicted PurR-regulated permease PerM